MARKGGLQAWIGRWRRARAAPARAPETPRREAAVPAVDLETCARALARRHRDFALREPRPLSSGNQHPRKTLQQHEHSLRRAYAVARVAVAEQRRIEPAAEWLLDNFYLVRTQLRELAPALSARTFRKLPRIAEGGDVAPRALSLAREYVAHVDGRIEPEQVGRFLAAYQGETALDIAELWTVPVLLRLALVERLAQGARVIAQRLDEYASAEYWARYLIDMAGKDASGMLMYVADMARLTTAITPAWVAEFYRLLEGKHPSLALALTWAEQQLDQRGLNVAHVIDAESRAQAADQVSIANCINALRLASRHNWSDTIEEVCAVDRILGGDPAQTYAQMDFTTRGIYRHAVEILSQRARIAETELAQRAVAAARDALSPTGDPRVNHVGYHLIGGGRAAFERALDATPPPR
ncbi:MAG TPA: hypothetical protein VGK80_01715, partial [Rhodanobacteraceae bacterium]